MPPDLEQRLSRLVAGEAKAAFDEDPEAGGQGGNGKPESAGRRWWWELRTPNRTKNRTRTQNAELRTANGIILS